MENKKYICYLDNGQLVFCNFVDDFDQTTENINHAVYYGNTFSTEEMLEMIDEYNSELETPKYFLVFFPVEVVKILEKEYLNKK